MAISKIIYKSSAQATPEVWMDATSSTAAAADITSPKTAMLADGVVTTGTGTGGGGGVDGNIYQDENGYLVIDPGSNPVADEKLVNFIDYDGSIRYSYTAAEFAQLSDLPANPTHERLTAQGWNWTKAQISAQLTAVPNGKIWVGQMYVTKSGATEIDIVLDDPDYLSPWLYIVDVKGTVLINWGDGESDTETGNNSTKWIQHIYDTTGNYTISISVTSSGENDSYKFYNSGGGSSASILYETNHTSDNTRYRTYTNAIKAIWVGEHFIAGNWGPFSSLSCCKYITLPNDVDVAKPNCFLQSRSLVSITIPQSVTSMSNAMFKECTCLKRVSIPSGATTFGTEVFQQNFMLESVTIPSGVTNIQKTTFTNNIGLKGIVLPSSLTTIGDNAFSTITFPSLTIPANVTSIGNTAFGYNYSVQTYHFLPTSPPTLGSTAFQNIDSGTIIYVPYSSDHSILNAYQTATNWSAYSSYIQEEPQS